MKSIISIPIVFCIHYLIFFFFISCIGGLSLYYDFAVATKIDTTILFLCIMKAACFTIPITIIAAAIGIYVFLLRYSMHLFLQITLFIVCLLLSIVFIIPICYAQLQFIEQSIGIYNLKPIADKFLIQFINKPLFLINLMTDINIFLTDLYTIYTKNFTPYIIFITIFFIFLCSLFTFSAISKWNMINITILIVLLRFFFFLYPFIKSFPSPLQFTRINTYNLLSNISVSSIYIFFSACFFYLFSGTRIYYSHKLKKQKRRK